MPWWKVIAAGSGAPKVDKKWLPAMLVVALIAAVAARWLLDRFGSTAVPFIVVAMVLLFVADVKIRRAKEGQAQSEETSH